MKKIILGLLFTFYSVFLAAQNTGELPYWTVMLPKSSVSGSDSCAVFDNASLKWKKIKCDTIVGGKYLSLKGNTSSTPITGNVYFSNTDTIKLGSNVNITSNGGLAIYGATTQICNNDCSSSLSVNNSGLTNIVGTSIVAQNSSTGITYSTDVSSGYTSRSLVDSHFVGQIAAKYIPLAGSSNISGDLQFNADGKNIGRNANNYSQYNSNNTYIQGGTTRFYSELILQSTMANAQLAAIDSANSSNDRVFNFNAGSNFLFFGQDAQYASDYSSSYTSRSLIDKGYLVSQLASYVPLSGGTLTGALILAADPTTALGAATKQYVDAKATSLLSSNNTWTGTESFNGKSFNIISGKHSSTDSAYVNIDSTHMTFTVARASQSGTVYVDDGNVDMIAASSTWRSNIEASSGGSALNFSNTGGASSQVATTPAGVIINSNDSIIVTGNVNVKGPLLQNGIPVGSGTVASVGVTLPTSIFSTTGSPVTTSGTIAATLQNQTANTVFAGPSSGGSSSPTFRSLVNADFPTNLQHWAAIDTSVKQTKLVSGTTIKTVNGNNLLGSGNITISGGSGGGAKNLSPTGDKTANYTAAPQDLVTVNTTSGSIVITLPSAPVDTTIILVKHVIQGGTNTVTVNTSGSDVFNKTGGGTSLVLSMNGQGASFQYRHSTGIWIITSDDLPLGQLDLRYQPILGFTSENVANKATDFSTVNNTLYPTTQAVNTAINNAIAGVNPATAVQASTTTILPNSPTYSNGASGVGATLTGGANVALVTDGYTYSLNDRILVKNQASAFQNGIYLVTQTGSIANPYILTRALDYNQSSNINNTGAIPVINGTVNTTTSWVLSSKITTVGTDALTFTEFSLNPAVLLQAPNNLSDVANTTIALSNIGAQPILVSGTNIKTINGNSLLGSGDVGAIGIAYGGSGQTTQQSAINALTGTQSAGKYLRSDGTNATLSAIQAADVPTLNQSTTGTAANITATSNSTLTTLSSLSLPFSQLTSLPTTLAGHGITNAVDITSAQTAAGAKTWSNLGTFSSGIAANAIGSISGALTTQPAANTGSSNLAGSGTIFNGGLGTGNATGGNFWFYPSNNTATGSTAQTLTSNPIVIGTAASTANPGIYFGGIASTNPEISYNGSQLSFNSNTGNNISFSAGSNSIIFSASNVTQTSGYFGMTGIGIYSNVFSGFGSGTTSYSGYVNTNSNGAGGDAYLLAGQGHGTGAITSAFIQAPITNGSNIAQTMLTLYKGNTTIGNNFYSTQASQVGQSVNGYWSGGSYLQTANLWQLTNGNGTILANADKNGNISTTGYMNGAMVNPRRAVTTATTLTSSDGIVEGNATSSAFTITLMDATTVVPGAEYTIVKNDASGNVVTVGTTSSQTINYPGASVTTFPLYNQYNLVTVYSNGSNWIVLYKL